MKSDPFQFFLVALLIFLKLVAASISEGDDEFSINFKGQSSDDEDSVRSGDLGLEEALENVHFGVESSGIFQKRADSQLRVADQNGVKPLSCLDGNGKEVDWWFAYKEPNGKRYLYLSSVDVESSTTPAKFLPLRSKYLINDPVTSPVLKTIYRSRDDASEVWMGWNDQPSDNLDAYGARVCPVKHAHSKGFYAQNAILTSAKEVVIGSYAILTSLPQFPQIAQGPYAFGGAVKNKLPLNQSQIFGTNLDANGQHFMCLSFPRERVTLETAEAEILEVPIIFNSVRNNFLTKYLKTIHPAIVGTNFADQNVGQWIWRRYFSLLKYPYSAAHQFLTHPNPNQKLIAYSVPDLPSFHYNRQASLIFIFPLTTSQFHRNKKGEIEYASSSFSSRWDVRFAHQNGCTDGNQQTCLQSFTFNTTTLQSGLSAIFFAKHPMSILDLYDDWATLQVAEAQKYVENYYAGQNVDRYGLLVQSWIDTKTVLPRKSDKKIYDRDGKLIAKVHIDNVAHFHMPQGSHGSMRVDTSHKDHSKWAIGFALDTFNTDGSLEDDEAIFNPLLFISDLNRATTQARLKGKNQGRGGGIVAISSSSLWHAFMDLSPRSYRQRFVTNGKNRTRQLQNRLRSHTSSFICNRFGDLPVVPLRKFTFKALRLSRKEAKKPVKAVKFVPVLNEISQFIKMAEFQPEHAAIAAFQRLFRNISEGKILEAARNAWDRTLQQLRSNSRNEIVSVADWPKLFAIPGVQFYREIPESREDDETLRQNDLEQQTEYLLIDSKTAVVSTGDIYDVFQTRINRLPRRTKETQTQTEDIEDEDEDNEDEDEDNEDEDEDEDNEDEDEDNESVSERSGSNYSYFDSDHSTEYTDHIFRYHRENYGSDYDGSDGGYVSP